MPEPPELLKCKFCKYEWYSEALLDMVTCPNCHRKFDRNEKPED